MIFTKLVRHSPLLLLLITAASPAWASDCVSRINARMAREAGKYPLTGIPLPPGKASWDLGETLMLGDEKAEEIGYVALTKVGVLGEGGMGKVFLIEAIDLEGKKQYFAFKESLKTANLIENARVRDLEDQGFQLQHIAVKTAQEANGPKGPPIHLAQPLRKLVIISGSKVVQQGHLIEHGKLTLYDLMKLSDAHRLDMHSPIDAGRAGDVIRNTAEVLRDLLRALGDLQKSYSVHRDIKPANVVWFGEPPRWGLIDFGLAGQEGHAFKGAPGTPGYMPPEAHYYPDPPADVSHDAYSIAVMMVEMLTGKGYAPERPATTKAKPDPAAPPGIVPLEADEVKSLLSYQRHRLEQAGVSKPDLELFDQIAKYAMLATEADPYARMEDLAVAQDSPVTSNDTGHILGPSKKFLNALEQSLRVRFRNRARQWFTTPNPVSGAP